jgi:hypothetical protein
MDRKALSALAFSAKYVLRFVVLAFAVVTLSSSVLLAQSDLGTISGFVKDPSNAVVANAKVTVRNESGVERSMMTNESGYYSLTNLPPGLYSVVAEASGFQQFESDGNKLDSSATLVVNATLTVGAATQKITVSASAEALQTESASVQELVTRSQVDALELNGRNPIFMANLIPGTRGGTLANLSFNFTQGPNNINGARTGDSLITYDGAPAVRTRANGTSIGAADVDSTQEIQIMTTDYAPEYGRSAGGQIRITSKSGTQQFHGAAYEYVRNTALDANTWQRKAANNFVTAPDHYNQFGYNISGPLYIPDKINADKTKFFGYWGEEWVRYIFTDQATVATVPTLLMRQGNFSELLNPSNIFYGHAVVITDPKTGLPFPGNIIPQPGTVSAGSVASANGLGILNSYPVPNLTTPIGKQNWLFFANHPQNQRKDTMAFDINLTPAQRLRIRRVYFSFWEYQPVDGGTNETPKYFNRPNQTNSLDHTWVISPSKVNEILFSYSQDIVHIPTDTAHFLDRTKGAIQGAGYFGVNYPYIYPTGKEIQNRIPTVNMSAFSGLSGGPYPSHSGGPIYNLSDSFTWVKWSHTFKFGALFEYDGENDGDEINVQACSTCTNNQNGQFLFSDNGAVFVRPGYALASSGAAAANAALGLFDTYSEIGQRAYTVFRGTMWEGFGQDTWKINQKLTLTYGARYTVMVPYHAIWQNMIVFDPNAYNPANAATISPTTGLITGSPTIAQLYNGMVIPGNRFPGSAFGRVPVADSGLYNSLFHGTPNYFSNIQYGDIQPRLGIAYQLNNKTVIRAGGGSFYTRLGVSDSIFLGGNPPFQPNASVSEGLADNPGAGGAAGIPLIVTTNAKNLKTPMSWGWNFTVQRELPGRSLLSVAYVAHRGLHNLRQSDINQPTLATVLANPGVNINAIRPYKGFGSIRLNNGVGSSIYNSLQLAWNRHVTNTFQFGVSYTYSKSSDNGSNDRDVVPYTYDTSAMWGPSEFDVRHILVMNYLYELPFLRGQSTVAAKFLSGWQISGITQFQTGTPCGVAGSSDYAGFGLDSNFGCGVNGQYWNVNGNPAIIGTFGTGGQWFATKNPDGSAIFTQPAKGTIVTQRVRDLVYGPGFQNWNMGLFKSIPINERFRFQFRAEAFNLFNHPIWSAPSFDPTSSTFGKVTTKTSQRNMQLSLRLEF